MTVIEDLAHAALEADTQQHLAAAQAAAEAAEAARLQAEALK